MLRATTGSEWLRSAEGVNEFPLKLSLKGLSHLQGVVHLAQLGVLGLDALHQRKLLIGEIGMIMAEPMNRLLLADLPQQRWYMWGWRVVVLQCESTRRPGRDGGEAEGVGHRTGGNRIKVRLMTGGPESIDAGLMLGKSRVDVMPWECYGVVRD